MSNIRWYILDEHGEAAPVTEMSTFFAWERVHHGERMIALGQADGDDSYVSTVLLATARGPNALPFETMVFGGPHDGERWRWATRAEALAGHECIVATMRQADSETTIEIPVAE